MSTIPGPTQSWTDEHAEQAPLFTLPHAQREREYPDLVRYLAEFELTLSDIRPPQMAMFIAARNAEPVIQGLEVPMASLLRDADPLNLAEREADNIVEMTAYCDDYLESRLPADEMDVSTAQGVEDLPRILPNQWLLEEIQPSVFYSKLAGQELILPIWQRPGAGTSDRSEEARERQLVQRSTAAPEVKEHAYVLLDTSRTMNDHDRRGTVARGLALGFLLKGYRERARLNLRPFTADVAALSAGSGREDFLGITRRIIELANSGQTRIQTALEQAVEDIRQEGPCLRASIMLITDGISRISRNPLGDERLHTFLLGDLFENQETAATIRTLKQWSTSFHRVWKNRFAEILAPTLGDVRAAGRLLEALFGEAGQPQSQAEADRLRRLHDNVASLLEQYKGSLGKGAEAPPEVRALEGRLAEAKQLLARSAARFPPAAHQTPAATEQALTLRMLASGGAGQSKPGTLGLWAYLKRLFAAMWRGGRGTTLVAVVFWQALLGGLLLAFGPRLAAHGLATAALLGSILVVANAWTLLRWTGASRLGRSPRMCAGLGFAMGGCAATVGAAWAAGSPAWGVLALAGILWNMELACLVRSQE